MPRQLQERLPYGACCDGCGIVIAGSVKHLCVHRCCAFTPLMDATGEGASDAI